MYKLQIEDEDASNSHQLTARSLLSNDRKSFVNFEVFIRKLQRILSGGLS